jgi:hypothetical protein
MPKTVAEYPDAVDRIVDAEVRPGSTTRSEVVRDVRGKSPQLTEEVAEDLADAIVTEERVIGAIETSGEVPTEAEIEAISAVSDDYDMSDRVQAVADRVSANVATVEEIEGAVSDRARQSDQLFREEIEGAIDSLEQQGQQIVGSDRETVVQEQAERRGAPSETAFRGAAARTVSTEGVAPNDVMDDATEISGVAESTADQEIPVIRDTSGEVVGLVGARTDELGESVAEEIGAEYLGGVSDIGDEFTTSGSGSRVDLNLRGRKVGEVDV